MTNELLATELERMADELDRNRPADPSGTGYWDSTNRSDLLREVAATIAGIGDSDEDELDAVSIADLVGDLKSLASDADELAHRISSLAS